MKRYSDQEKATALARLEFNRGNAQKTSRELKIPRTTVCLWRDQALEAGTVDAVTNQSTDFSEIRHKSAALLLDLIKKAAAVQNRELDKLSNEDDDAPMRPAALHEVTRILDAAATQFVYLTDGRPGTAITVDARSVHSQLDGVSTAELRRMLAGGETTDAISSS